MEAIRTPLYPIINNYISEFDRIISDKIMQWRMFPAKWKLDVINFYGKRINFDGVTYEGTPRHVFWNGFIEPFLENAIEQTLQNVIGECSKRALNLDKYLDEACALLESLVQKTYDNMAETDRILRGKGFPRSVELHNVSDNIEQMNKYITSYRKALTHGEPNTTAGGTKEPSEGPSMTSVSEKRKVFVVHGRNKAARDALFEFLRAIGLQPIEFSHAIELTGKASPYVGEILDVAFSNAQAVVILLTGDDEVKLRYDFLTPSDEDYEKNIMPQARPNVLFEAGLAFGFHPERTILIELGKIKPFSDVGGRHTIRMDNSPEKRHELAKRLETAGCSVDTTGTDWLKVANFDNAIIPFKLLEKPDEDSIILKEEQINILKLLGEAEERGNRLILEEISSNLKLSLVSTRHHLDLLKKGQYIIAYFGLGQPLYGLKAILFT